MKHSICLVWTLCCTAMLFGQGESYRGGNGDGYGKDSIRRYQPGSSTLLFAPYFGGTGNGYTRTESAAFNSNAYIGKFSPYSGGSGDGWAGQPRLIITAVNGYTGCGDLNFTLNYQYNGTTGPGNLFTAELSSGDGQFAQPSVIGTLSTTAGTGTISCSLPPDITPGSAYAIRVTGSNPVIRGYSVPIQITFKPALGNDSTLFILCGNERTDISTLYPASGLIVNWGSTQPASAPAGVHTLIVTNSDGCRDTAVVTLKQDIAVWNGTVSSDWHTPSNWNTGKVPGTGTHVIVPAGTLHPCSVSTAHAAAASLQARSNAIVNVSAGFILEITARCSSLPAGP